MCHVDLNWADNQYLSTLIDVMSEYSNLYKQDKKEYKKADTATMKKFIRKEGSSNG